MRYTRLGFVAFVGMTVLIGTAAHGVGGHHRHHRSCDCSPCMVVGPCVTPQLPDGVPRPAGNLTVGQMGAFLVQLKARIAAEKNLTPEGQKQIEDLFQSMMGPNPPALSGTATVRAEVEASLRQPDKGGFQGELAGLSSTLQMLQARQRQ